MWGRVYLLRIESRLNSDTVKEGNVEELRKRKRREEGGRERKGGIEGGGEGK